MIKFYFQLLIPIALMFCRFPRRKGFWIRLPICLVVSLVLSLLYNDPSVIPFLPNFFQNLIFYLVAYFFAIMSVIICFDMPISSCLFFAVEACVVQNFSHHLFEFIMRFSGVNVGDEYSSIWYLVTLGGIYLVVYSIFFFLVDKLKLRNVAKIPNSSILVEVIFFLVMIVLGVYIRHSRDDLFSEMSVALGYELYSTFLAGLMLLMLLGIFNIGKLQETNEEFETRLALEGKYYRTAQKSADEIATICHNLKHQIAALRNMDNVEEKEEIITELEKSVSFYASIGKTGNPALDCVLTEAGMSCSKHEITLSVMADGSLIDGIKFNDVYVMFGNIVENAIESNLKCQEKNKRYIDIKIYERGGMCYVHVENWCDPSFTFNGDLPKTSKKEKGHGYGTKSIAYLAEKYGGTTHFEAINGVFYLDILLPLKDEEEPK